MPNRTNLTTKPTRWTLPPILVLVLAVFMSALLESFFASRFMMYQVAQFGSGIALIAVYHLQDDDRRKFIALISPTLVLPLMIAGLSLPAAILVSAGVTVQCVAGALILRRLLPDGIDTAHFKSIFAITAVAVFIAPLVGIVIMFGFRLLLHTDLIAPPPDFEQGSGALAILVTWVSWSILPLALGVILTAPIVTSFISGGALGMPRNWTPKRSLIMLGAIGINAVILLTPGHGLHFLIAPPLIVVALQLGVRDTAIALIATLLIASFGTAANIGPVAYTMPDPALRLPYLQAIFIVGIACLVPVAATIETRRRLELSLEQTVRYTDQILTNINEIVFRTDAEGRWTYLNPAWQHVTGYSAAESLGWLHTRLLSLEDQVKARLLYPHLISGESEELNLHQRFVRKDGQLRDAEVSVRAVRDQAGNFVGMTGTMRDTTDQSAYVRALEASELRFRELCDTAPVGIVRVDVSGAITYANNLFELLSLRAEKHLIGQFWYEALGIDNADLRRQMRDALVTPGAVHERELEFNDFAGQKRWGVIVATGEFDADGRLTGYIATMTDISRRKYAERELAAKNSEMRLLAENISDVVLRIALDGKCLYATPSIREVLGHDPQWVLGRAAVVRIHPEDEPAVHQAITAMIRGDAEQTTVSYRYHPDLPDTEYIWLEANAKLLRDQHGRPREIITVLRDVTDRKQLELELTEARQRAESAAEAKSAFLANFSHEIRTPMNGVIGLTDLLLQRELDETSRNYAKLIASSGETMMKLLNDILDLAKIEAGRVQLSRQSFDLHDLLRDSLRLMTAVAVQKGIELHIDLAGDLPRRAVGDDLRLRQILSNLVGNAVKFTDAGSVSLAASREDNMVVIAVRDTGVGISCDQHDKVFNEFVQADCAVAGNVGGTGLGLPISRKLAELMGGALTLVSEPGVGTVMTLRLPLEWPSCGSALSGPSVVMPAIVRGAAMRILVAEDNLTNQIIIEGMLKRLGHETTIAGDGAAAIQAVSEAEAEARPFDLVLMDVFMPGVDGLSAAREIRAMGYDHAHLPIIAVTANAYQEDIDRCLAAGMQAHISKPVSLAQLSVALADFTPHMTAQVDDR